jgi:hypothetical protein
MCLFEHHHARRRPQIIIIITTTLTVLRYNVAVLGEVHETAENTEFEFEFHAVYQSFVCGLDVVQAGVFEAEDGEIKEHGDGVDMDETGYDFSRCLPGLAKIPEASIPVSIVLGIFQVS